MTALHIASGMGNDNVVKMLLAANADINVKDKVSRILCVYMCPKLCWRLCFVVVFGSYLLT